MSFAVDAGFAGSLGLPAATPLVIQSNQKKPGGTELSRFFFLCCHKSLRHIEAKWGEGIKVTKLFFVGLGGFIGTLGRYWLSEAIARRYGETFPLGTLIVNALGCFLIGLLFYLLYDRIPVNPTSRGVVFVGLLGGFTTFSAYGLHTFTLVRDGELVLALLNVAVSNVLCLVLVWFGYTLAKLIA
jgi:CrcB protein